MALRRILTRMQRILNAVARRVLGRTEPVVHDQLDFRQTYRKLVADLRHAHGDELAMRMAVGQNFEAVGELEFQLLRHFGLQPSSYLIDVGCGSGRLSRPLASFLDTGQYLGIDVVPDLLHHARRTTGRSNWRFEVAEGLTIPEVDGAADMVCFFSVFTHLLHEQSYAYLQDARRVLKPGGKIILSFLDYRVPEHWSVLEFNIRNLTLKCHPLNVFLSPDALEVWASHLGLHIEALHQGHVPFIPLVRPVVFDDGRMQENVGSFSQSVCVLVKDREAGLQDDEE